MRQYVWEFPWWPSLSWASTSTVYFQDLGITKVRNFLPASVMCLYRRPLTGVKVSTSWWGALPFSNLLEMCLQNGSVLCIWSKASRQSAVSGFGVVVGSWEIGGVVFVWGVEVVLMVFWVWLLVWKPGPSLEEAVSMLMVVLVGVTNLERQSAALFLAPEIHSKEMLYVASSKLYLLTLFLVFFPLRKRARGLWSFLTMMSAPCK